MDRHQVVAHTRDASVRPYLETDVGDHKRHATERMFEIFDCAHCHRVTHLLVELRNDLGGLKAVVDHQMRMVQINGT